MKNNSKIPWHLEHSCPKIGSTWHLRIKRERLPIIKTTLLLTLISFATILSLGEMPAEADDKPPSAEKLVEQLGSKDFAGREKAAKLLQARGTSVLAVLLKGLDHPDAEVRRRVELMLPALEALIALEPKRVTLHSEKQSLSAAVKEITKQTGYHLEFDGSDDGRLYDLEMNKVPFWEALERLRKQTNEAVNVHFLEKGFQLKKGGGQPSLTSINGSFRLEVTQLHEDRDIDFTEAGKNKEIGIRNNRLKLTVSVAAELRFMVLGFETVCVDVALDEDSEPLRQPPASEEGLQDTSLRSLFRESSKDSTNIVLQRSSGKGKTIKVIRGTVPVMVMVERKPKVITDKVLASTGTKFQIGDGNLEIIQSEIDKDGNYKIRLSLPPDRKGIDLHWHDRIQIEDANGNKYEANGRSTSTSGNNKEISFHYGQPKDPKVGLPSKLIIEDWVILHHEVPFEFKDVPLP
jgi:hypothetical protein